MQPVQTQARKEVKMKELNYELREIIYQNLEQPKRQEIPSKPTKRQIEILQSIVIRKRMSKPFLEFVSECLFDTHDFSSFDYRMMYEFVYVLSRYKTSRERSKENE